MTESPSKPQSWLPQRSSRRRGGFLYYLFRNLYWDVRAGAGTFADWLRREKTGSLPSRRALSRARRRRLAATAVLLLGALSGVGYGGYRWYQFHVGQQLLIESSRAAQAQKWPEALAACRQYVERFPEELAGWKQLVAVLDRPGASRASWPAIVEALEHALDLDRRNRPMLARTAELMLALDRLRPALRYAEQLLEEDPMSTLGWRVRALAQYRLMEREGQPISETAVEWLRTACRLNPQDTSLSLTLADSIQQQVSEGEGLDRQALAIQVLDELVDGAPERAASWLARHEFRRRYGIGGAAEDLEEALALAPQDPDVLWIAGQDALRRNEVASAEEFFGRLRESNPQDPRGVLGTGDAQAAGGDYETAANTFRQALDGMTAPDVGLTVRLARALIELGRVEEAQQALRNLEQSLEERGKRLSDDAQADMSVTTARMLAHLARGDFARARTMMDRLSQLQSSLQQRLEVESRLQLHLARSTYYERIAWPERAVVETEAALVLEPDRTEWTLRAADQWFRGGHLEAAQRLAERGVAAAPQSPRAWEILSQILLEAQLRQPPEARAWQEVQQALETAQELPDSAQHTVLLAADLAQLKGQPSEAVKRLQAAVEADPSEPRWALALVRLLDQTGAGGAADRAVEHFVQAAGEQEATRQLRALRLAQRGRWDRLEALMAEATPGVDLSVPTWRLSPHLQALLMQGRLDDARGRLDATANSAATDLVWRRLQAEWAVVAEDWTGLNSIEQRLRALEGADGCWWRYYRAWRLWHQEAVPNRASENEAAELQAEVLRLREKWPPGLTLEGLLAEWRGQQSRALGAYQAAIETGGAPLAAYQRLVDLAVATSNDELAVTAFEQLIDRCHWMQRLVSQPARCEDWQLQLATAVAAEERNVRESREELPTSVWLGYWLHQVGRHSEANRAIQRSLDRDPADVRGWLVLLATAAPRGEATLTPVLARVEQNAKLSGEQREALFQFGQWLKSPRASVTVGNPEASQPASGAAKQTPPAPNSAADQSGAAKTPNAAKATPVRRAPARPAKAGPG